MQNTSTLAKPQHHPDGADVLRTLDKSSFATLATTSPAGRPHVAGVLYALAGDDLFVSTLTTSRKARNIVANPHVAICVPVRRLPVGPPSAIHFQTTAELLEPDDPIITGLVASGDLKSITSHGELDLPEGCFVRIALPQRVATYGLGMSLRRLIADPLAGGGAAELPLAPS